MQGLRFKTRVFTGIVILTNVLGNFSLTVGMKRVGELSLSPLMFLKAMATPWVALGISLLILWLLSRMALLSWADLSYVLPTTSAGYVITAIIGKYFFAEQVSWQRWLGTLLIVGGITLVGLTHPRTSAATVTEAL